MEEFYYLKCKQCGGDFRARGIHRRYCSLCRKVRNRKACIRHDRKYAGKCLNCGKQLLSKGTKRCGTCHNFRINRENKGINAWAYKAGRSRTVSGYILIMQHGHPRVDNRGYVREHILVWEEAHGKPLPKGWIIHHLNGVRDDNRIENLLAMPYQDHSRWLYISTLQERIKVLEGKLNVCTGVPTE